MPTPSTIDRLPDDIKAKLQALLQDPRVTQLDATAKINSILEAEGHEDRVTKSAVNRYAVRMKEVGEKLKQSREVAQMYIAQVGASPQGQTGLLINEMLRSMAFDLTLKIQDADIADPETLAATIDQVKSLALAVQRLESAATSNVKREDVIRKQEREKALNDAAEAVEKAAVQQGMNADQAAFWRQQVLGVQ